MTEALLLITAIIFFVLGWFAHFFAAKPANELNHQAFTSLLNAWNLRFGVKPKAETPTRENWAVYDKTPVAPDQPEQPKKVQHDLKPPDLIGLRAQAIKIQEKNQRAAIESTQHIP